MKQRLFVRLANGCIGYGFAQIHIASGKSPAAGGWLYAPADKPDPVSLARNGAGNDFGVKVKDKPASRANLPDMLLLLDIALFERAPASRAELCPRGIRWVLEHLMNVPVWLHVPHTRY
jgi:hypothetical protein